MSSVKPLCKSTELNRCITTDRRWKRKLVSRSFPGRLANLRLSSLKNSKDEELKAPKFSIAIGWNIWSDDKLWYFSALRSAAISATAPQPVVALST